MKSMKDMKGSRRGVVLPILPALGEHGGLGAKHLRGQTSGLARRAQRTPRRNWMETFRTFMLFLSFVVKS